MTPMPPECARLAAELRALRERSGLALSALAADSPYSKSSWQRYLAGSALPPWSAVQVLCRAANEPEARARALWELAECAWSRRTAIRPPDSSARVPEAADRSQAGFAAAADTESCVEERRDLVDVVESASVGRRSWTRRRTGAATSLAVLLVAATITVAVVDNRNSHHSTNATTAGFHVACTGSACSGHDPQVTGCGVEPQTLIHEQTPSGFGLEIRYNPLCRAAWARVWNVAPGDRLTLSSRGLPAQSVSVTHPSDIDPFVYTPLLATAPGSVLTACVTNGSGAPPRCYSTRQP